MVAVIEILPLNTAAAKHRGEELGNAACANFALPAITGNEYPRLNICSREIDCGIEFSRRAALHRFCLCCEIDCIHTCTHFNCFSYGNGFLKLRFIGRENVCVVSTV